MWTRYAVQGREQLKEGVQSVQTVDPYNTLYQEGLSRTNISFKIKCHSPVQPTWNGPDHSTQSFCQVRSALWVLLSVVMLMRGERPELTAALIGQALGSSVSFSKWRHVRPVRLQLGPDCFPEALEASPCPSAHRSERRVHPTMSGPDLSWHEEVRFLVWDHAGEECYTQRCHANVKAKQYGANQFTAAHNLLWQVFSVCTFASKCIWKMKRW